MLCLVPDFGASSVEAYGRCTVEHTNIPSLYDLWWWNTYQRSHFRKYHLADFFFPKCVSTFIRCWSPSSIQRLLQTYFTGLMVSQIKILSRANYKTLASEVSLKKIEFRINKYEQNLYSLLFLSSLYVTGEAALRWMTGLIIANGMVILNPFW